MVQKQTVRTATHAPCILIQVTARREGFNGPLKVDMNNPFSIEAMTVH